MPETITCAQCGTPFARASTRGRKPKICDDCDAAKNLSRRQRAKTRSLGDFVGAISDDEEAQTTRFAIEDAIEESKPRRPDKTTWAERLAVGLSLSRDLRVAARSVGLDFMRQRDLKKLEVEAVLRHQDLIDGRASAVAKQLHAAMMLAILELRAKIPNVSPAVLASSIKALSNSIAEFSGGSQRIFSVVKIVLPEGHGGGLTQDECLSVIDPCE